MDSNPLVVHVDQLKPFQGRKHPENWLREREMEPESPGPQPIQQETPILVRSRRGRVIRPRDLLTRVGKKKICVKKIIVRIKG